MTEQALISSLIASTLLISSSLALAGNRDDGKHVNNQLERKGDRMDLRLDRKGDNIDRRVDRKGNRIERRARVRSRS